MQLVYFYVSLRIYRGKRMETLYIFNSSTYELLALRFLALVLLLRYLHVFLFIQHPVYSMRT